MIDKFDSSHEDEILTEKKSVRAKLPNALNMVMIFCIIIAGVLFMGEIELTFGSILNVSLLVAIIYLIASIAYRNNYQNGMYAAMKDDEYCKAKERYEKAKHDIYSLGIASKLGDYCVRYIEQDLKKYRASILADACIPYDKYESDYIGKTYKELMEKGLSKKTARCIVRANKASGIKINTGTLLTSDSNFHRHRGLGMSTLTRRNVDFATNMVSRLFTTLLSGTVVIDVIINPSWQSLAQWALRMVAIFWAAVSGYDAGVKNISETTLSYISRKTEILKIFISWNEKEQGT